MNPFTGCPMQLKSYTYNKNRHSKLCLYVHITIQRHIYLCVHIHIYVATMEKRRLSAWEQEKDMGGVSRRVAGRGWWEEREGRRQCNSNSMKNRF